MDKKYSKGGGNKAKAFLKRNMYYIIMGVCILAIGAMITVAVLSQNGNDPEIPDPNTQDPGPVDPGPTDPTGPSDPEIPEPPVPIVFNLPVASNNIIREHTMTTIIYWETLRKYAVHNGIDFAGEAGETVAAAYAGTVIAVEYDMLNGHAVKIDHGNGLITYYGSLDAAPAVTVGQTVTAGQRIGGVGTSASGELELGNHLHFSVSLNGNAVNPFDYFETGDK